jgi:hypothetical protein
MTNMLNQQLCFLQSELPICFIYTNIYTINVLFYELTFREDEYRRFIEDHP